MLFVDLWLDAIKSCTKHHFIIIRCVDFALIFRNWSRWAKKKRAFRFQLVICISQHSPFCNSLPVMLSSRGQSAFAGNPISGWPFFWCESRKLINHNRKSGASGFLQVCYFSGKWREGLVWNGIAGNRVGLARQKWTAMSEEGCPLCANLNWVIWRERER